VLKKIDSAEAKKIIRVERGQLFDRLALVVGRNCRLLTKAMWRWFAS
jgi:hypothetical protein